jgi:hypothetical protein
MIRTGIALGNGYRLTSKGKLERIKGFGLTAVQKAAQRSSKKQKPVRRVTHV